MCLSILDVMASVFLLVMKCAGSRLSLSVCPAIRPCSSGRSDGLNFHAKQIAHANVLMLVDVEGNLRFM